MNLRRERAKVTLEWQTRGNVQPGPRKNKFPAAL
jgi:hypothetical protein